MRVGVLTSSRADYGIYRPLLQQMGADPFFELTIMAFGTHLSAQYGLTLQDIIKDGFKVKYKVKSLLDGDSENAISKMMALTAKKFSDIWEVENKQLDLTFCLGDRYEMFSAVSAAVPYNVSFAHIHGGETTLGAIDNTFRHCLTLMSDYHFTSHKKYTERVKSLKGNTENVYTTGALSLDNLFTTDLYSVQEFHEKFGVDLSKPTILFTFHPETINPERNEAHIQEVLAALTDKKKYQILITGTNTDTYHSLIRNELDTFHIINSSRFFPIENLGTRAYFSAMKHCSFLLGNTSSGIIEAASLGAYVINLGDRQKGRISGSNVLDTPVQKEAINRAIAIVEKKSRQVHKNIYWQGGAATKIIQILKKDFNG